jgi:hypothetical protein
MGTTSFNSSTAVPARPQVRYRPTYVIRDKWREVCKKTCQEENEDSKTGAMINTYRLEHLLLVLDGHPAIWCVRLTSIRERIAF